jgi:uncharacterized protein YlzI (FlbEa/FlbD family)
MIRLTEKAGGQTIYLNPSAIESVSRPSEVDCAGAVIRTMTSAVHAVTEKPEAVMAMVDGSQWSWKDIEPRWRIPYPPR